MGQVRFAVSKADCFMRSMRASLVGYLPSSQEGYKITGLSSAIIIELGLEVIGDLYVGCGDDIACTEVYLVERLDQDECRGIESSTIVRVDIHV